MSFADLNELTEASYNELRRIGFIPDKDKEMLTSEDIQEINNKVNEKVGDLLLAQTLQYKEGKLEQMNYKFNNRGTYTQLILMFTLCYVNNMDLNDYFQIKV